MISERLQSAIDLRVSGHVQEAVKALQAIIGQTEDLDEKVGAQLNLVTGYMLLGSLPAARVVWQEASCLSSSMVEIQPYVGFMEACLLKDEGKVEQAAAKFKQLLRDYADAFKSPENRELYEDIRLRLAYVLIRLDRLQEARPLLEEALTYSIPAAEKTKLLCHLGDFYIAADDYKAAQEYYESAREMGIPKEWEGHVHYFLGVAYAELGLFREAKQEFGSCESKLDEYALSRKEVYRWLAFVSKRLGESEKAREYKRLSLTA